MNDADRIAELTNVLEEISVGLQVHLERFGDREGRLVRLLGMARDAVDDIRGFRIGRWFEVQKYGDGYIIRVNGPIVGGWIQNETRPWIVNQASAARLFNTQDAAIQAAKGLMANQHFQDTTP